MLPKGFFTSILATLLMLMAAGTRNQAAPNVDDLSGDIKLTGIPGPYNFGRFCHLQTNELWAVGGEGSVRYNSSSGAIERRITDEDLHGVYFVNSDVGWVVGDSGSILHTGDRGYSWSRQDSGVMQSLRSIKCTDERRCWAVGAAGTVLKTGDGGQHWQNTLSNQSADLFAVDFIGDRIGWAAGEDGIILHTNDGGQDWKIQRATITLFPGSTFATPTDLLTIKFLDEKVGWVAGTGGVARTLDGGRTWQPIQIEDGSFVGLATADGRTVWAINSHGANYITNNSGLTWKPITEQSLVKKLPKRLTQLSSMPVRKRRAN